LDGAEDTGKDVLEILGPSHLSDVKGRRAPLTRTLMAVTNRLSSAAFRNSTYPGASCGSFWPSDATLSGYEIQTEK